LIQPDEMRIPTNVFQSAEYWLQRGYMIHTGKNKQKSMVEEQKETEEIFVPTQEEILQALDFYF